MEISCSVDANVLDKEDEKVSNYQALTREVSLVTTNHSYCVWSLWDSVLLSDHILQKLPSYSDQLFNQLQQAVTLRTIYCVKIYS